MKILTYNAWHGLNGKGVLAHGELESAERRAARLVRQTERLGGHEPSIAFLQEVNPLARRAPDLARTLGMNVVTQADLCGIKVWGRGIPLNLSSGLAILAKEPLRKLRGLRLSGSPWSFATPRFSLQWKETRYALLAELKSATFGKLLVVNAHLHHGLEPSEALQQAFQDLVDQKVMTSAQRDQILGEMNHARERRHGEGTRLLAEIHKLEKNHDGVVLAGDFNADPDSAIVDLVRRSGLVDAVPAGVHTWDRLTNSHNFTISEAFDLGISDFGVPAVKQALKTHERRVTRLDHVFLSRNLADRIDAVGLFGHEGRPEDMTSDHFGVAVRLH